MYRLSWQTVYPAAINDLHAVYKWMIENAEMLGIDPGNVVIYGQSTGGHLAASLAFRLMRYGYSPKGIVAIVPQMDDREKDTTAGYICSRGWDAQSQHSALAQWLGNNFASSRYVKSL